MFELEVVEAKLILGHAVAKTLIHLFLASQQDENIHWDECPEYQIRCDKRKFERPERAIAA